MQLQYKKTGATGRITLFNPPYNSLIHPVFADKNELVEFLNDRELKSIIIQGAGKHFCSGAEIENLAELARDPAALQTALDCGKELLTAISESTIPVAALISGSCLGGGLELALCCHFRFAAQNAMLGFPESDYGLMPGMGGTVLALEAINRRNLIELLLSGKMVRAEEALEMGMVDQISSPRTIEDDVIAFLDRLTSRHPPELIRSVMRSINNGRQMPRQKALEEETKIFCQLARSNAPSVFSNTDR